MIRKILLLPILIIFFAGTLNAQQLVSVNDLFSTDEYLNNIVEVVGTVDRHTDIDSSSDVQGFVLRDQFGDEVIVRTTNEHPTVNRTYVVTGTFEEGPRQGNRPFFFIREQNRSLAENDDLHTVRINSVPEGAEVEMDGSVVGSTPHTIRLPDGNYTFRLQRPFYESRTVGLVVNGNGTERNVELQRSILFYLVSGGGIVLLLLGGGYLYSSLKNRGESSPGPKPIPKPMPEPKVNETNKTGVVENKTIKIVNPTEKTVKIVPGKFEVLSGIDELQELRLYTDPKSRQSEYTFGRDPGPGHYHFQVKSNTVSRRQAKLIVTKNDYSLINYSDTNPTIVNGSPMDINDSYTLNPGDIIEMGEVRLKFDK